MTSVALHRLLGKNTFLTISFIYRRKAHDGIGYFDEYLLVLGHWDLHIRFLLKYDIGLTQETLARYHHRLPNATPAYSNTVVSDVKTYLHYETVLRNRYLRKDIQDGVAGLSVSMGVAEMFEAMQGSLDESNTQGQRLQATAAEKDAGLVAVNTQLVSIERSLSGELP